MCCVSVGRQKLHLALDSGTTQKAEDFEVRENWILGCGDYLLILLLKQLNQKTLALLLILLQKVNL